MRPFQSNAMGDLRCEASDLKADSVLSYLGKSVSAHTESSDGLENRSGGFLQLSMTSE